MQQYLSIIIFVLLSIIGALIAINLPKIPFYKRMKSYNKTMPYECGFDPITNIKEGFNVRFYYLAIMFIIVDVEICFLVPWVIIFFNTTLSVFIAVMLFLAFFLVGFIYELSKNVTEN